MHSFSNWLNHPVYFLFWFFLGAYGLTFSFDCKKCETAKVSQFSSMAEDQDVPELADTNFQEMQALSDDQLLNQLEQNSQVRTENPYALSLEEIQQIDQEVYPTLNGSPNDFQYEPIAEDTLKTEVENPKDAKVCPAPRLFYEKQITSNPKLKELASTREVESKELPRKCLIHVMNKMGLPKVNLGVCAKASGGVKTGGAKPCVSDNLVNLTYNSYVDVMDCLNLKAKTFLPKIARESGFLLNAYGIGKDGGIGQFTKSAIDAVNGEFQNYMTEIEKAAATKPSCARIMKYKPYLTKASSAAEQRCSMIGTPENPLRNILYVGIFNKSNMNRFAGSKYIAGQDYFVRGSELVPVKNNSTDEFDGVFKDNKYKESLVELGFKNPNMHFFKEVLALAGYNMGSPTSIRLFSKYLEKRKQAKKKLIEDDFDFNRIRLAKDTFGDGKEKNVIEIARSFIMSSFISAKDTAASKAAKLKKRKQLPKEWAASYLKSFPEFLTLNANNYDGKQTTAYDVYGAPGYVSYVADKNRELRKTFNSSGIDPNYCSDPDFLTFKAE